MTVGSFYVKIFLVEQLTITAWNDPLTFLDFFGLTRLKCPYKHYNIHSRWQIILLQQQPLEVPVKKEKNVPL